MTRAQAVISPTVSPRSRMAVTAAATCAGVGSPRRAAAKNASASCFIERRAVGEPREQGLEGV